MDSALSAACFISLLWSSLTEEVSVAPDAAVAAGAEKRANDEDLEEEEESPSVGIKQVECNDLRNGVEQKEVAAPRNVEVFWMKLFPADERDMTLKPRANPKFRVEAMIAIDTASRDGFIFWYYLPTISDIQCFFSFCSFCNNTQTLSTLTKVEEPRFKLPSRRSD